METKNLDASQLEKEYDRRRQELMDKVDLKLYVDHPFLFTRRQRVTDFLTRIEIFKRIVGVPGAVVECGVHKGGSLMLYYHLSSILEPMVHTRKIIGFDTFAGFRSLSDKDPDEVGEEMFADTSYDILTEAVAVNDLNRAIPHVPKCEVVRGDATQTIPEYRQEHPELIIALLYLDFDIYEPTKVAIEQLLPLVPKGGIVVFDELNSKKWAGETEALKDCLNLNEINLQRFYFDPWPSFFVVGE